jgi:hypothetical protein
MSSKTLLRIFGKFLTLTEQGIDANFRARDQD